MADLLSTLRLGDGYSAPGDAAVNAIEAVISAMDQANTASDRIDLSGMGTAIVPASRLSAGFDQMENAIVSVIYEAEVLEDTIGGMNHRPVDQMADAVEAVYREVDGAEREWRYLNETAKRTPDEPIRRAAGGFSALSKSIIVANQGVELLQKGFQMLSSTMDKVDSRNSADARLSLVKDELRTQQMLEEQVLQTANLTRTSYETTAQLVAKVGRTEFFKGQNDAALRFAETINKSFIVSGATTAAAEGSIQQLTQALSSGVLRGDEFNSVMEGAPMLAELIASELQITTGEMRALAAEGALTAEAVAGAVLNQSEEIDALYAKMPMTFSQGMSVIGNFAGVLTAKLSEPGEAFHTIIMRVQELIDWLQTVEGQEFMDGIGDGINMAVDAMTFLLKIATSTYRFFSDNWTTIEPILKGIGVAVGILAAAFLVYKTYTMIATAVQWGLNAAMLANPALLIAAAIILLIAIIAMIVVAIVNLWKTNIDFKVGVIGIWNSILAFFDQVPIFFIGIGYGIADGFSIAKEKSFLILQSMVNGAIGIINNFTGLINSVLGTSIDAIGDVTFGTEAALAEQAARDSRADDLSQRKLEAAAKSAERERKLLEDETKWRAEAEEHTAEGNDTTSGGTKDPWSWTKQDVNIGGGKLDEVGKVGKEIDLSDQTLAYLYDIAEKSALMQFDALSATATVLYEETEAKLNEADKDALLKNSGQGTRIYYLNYQGGVNVSANVQNGESWESIKEKAYRETQSELEIGLSGVEVLTTQ